MVRGRNDQDEMNVLMAWLPLQTKLQTTSPLTSSLKTNRPDTTHRRPMGLSSLLLLLLGIRPPKFRPDISSSNSVL